jgi:tetratricopeptide (TPR) repeat protein
VSGGYVQTGGIHLEGISGPVYLGAIPQIASLYQVPSAPADFTDRTEDLATLKAALASSRIGAVFGMGGVGKSALAFRLAAELAPLYPDAQLYLDLKGVDPQPLAASQAMAHVVRSFHPETRLPESEAEIAGLYRSVLHGKRALLLMDSARDKGQIEPLIPPTGNALLVTSRFHFALPGMTVSDLDELPEADACDLLLRIAPRIDSAAAEIARLCGRLPLALRLAGSALGERPELSPADYGRRLREGTLRFDPVEASLNVSYELLSEEPRRLWRRLAVFPGTFDPPAAAAVWDLEADPAADALGELARSSLVERDDKDGRYRLHDLARSFADRRLQDAEREIARGRHAQHYLKVLQTADDLFEMRGSVLSGLALFDTEWGSIQAGQAWAASLFPEDAEAARACSDYSGAGGYLLDLRQHPRDQVRWRELALAAARKLGDRRAEGVHLRNLGNSYADLGEHRRAIELFEQGLAIARETGDRRGEGRALGNLGIAYADLGEPRRAIELYEQDLAIARELGDRRGEGKTLGNLGNVHFDLGEYRRAIEVYEQALAITRETGDRRGEGQTLGNLGNAHLNLGNHRRAIELYEQDLAIAREIGDRRGEGAALGNLGIVYAALGKRDRAIELYEQDLALAREIGDRRGEVIASWNLGDEIERQGDLVRAADLMQVRVDYEREIGHADAEKNAAYLADLRARIAKKGLKSRS